MTHPDPDRVTQPSWRSAPAVVCPECGATQLVDPDVAADPRMGGYCCEGRADAELHHPVMMVPALCSNCGETDPEYVSDSCSRCGHQTSEGGYFCGSNYCDDPACEGEHAERL